MTDISVECEYLSFHASHSINKQNELVVYSLGYNLCLAYLKSRIRIEYLCEQFNCDSYRKYLYMLKPYLSYNLMILYKLY